MLPMIHIPLHATNLFSTPKPYNSICLIFITPLCNNAIIILQYSLSQLNFGVRLIKSQQFGA